MTSEKSSRTIQIYANRFEECSRSSQKSLLAPFTKEARRLMLNSGLLAHLINSYSAVGRERPLAKQDGTGKEPATGNRGVHALEGGARLAEMESFDAHVFVEEKSKDERHVKAVPQV